MWLRKKQFLDVMAPKWGPAAAVTQWWLLKVRLASVVAALLLLTSIGGFGLQLFVTGELLLLATFGAWFFLQLKSFGEASRSLRVSWNSTPPTNPGKYVTWCLSQGLKPYSASA